MSPWLLGPPGGATIPGREAGEGWLVLDFVLGGLVALCLLVYLVCALLRAEAL